MKAKILIFLYVFFVLFLAAKTKADVIIDHYDYSPSRSVLGVSGRYSEDCKLSFSPSVTPLKSDGSAFLLNFFKTECVGVSLIPQKPFSVTYDVRHLALPVGKPILIYLKERNEKGAKRTLVITLESTFNNVLKKNVDFKGILIQYKDNFYVRDISNSQFLVLSDFNLTPFVGKTVRVVGEEVKHQVGPVYQLFSRSPLNAKKVEGSDPVVIKIKTIFVI